jgi:hypothetical protein
MKFAAKSVLFLAAAAFAAVLADPASASGRHRKSVRARSIVAADATSSAAGAKLQIRLLDASSSNWELRMDLRRAPTDLAPEAWIADADGTLSLGGTFAVSGHRGADYRLRLRGKNGDTLPAGAATLSELGGRAFEIRDGGVAFLSGNLPDMPAASTAATTGATDPTSTGGADDGATHEAGEHAAGTDDSTSAGTTTGDTTTTGTTTSDDPSGHDAGDDHGGSSGSGGSGGSGGHGGDDGSGHN